MLKPDEFIEEFLQHAQPYDPVKRREYYLRTRQLKGRTVGKVDSGFVRPGSQTKTVSVGIPAKKPAAKKTQEQRRAEAQARVAALQKRLDTLKTVLARLVEQAKVRSGVESKPSPDKTPESKTKDSPKEKAKPLTAQEKKEAAKKAREAYEKEQKSQPNKTQALEAEIRSVQEKIIKARAELKASMERAREKAKVEKSPESKPTTKPDKSKAKSKTASKGR